MQAGVQGERASGMGAAKQHGRGRGFTGTELQGSKEEQENDAIDIPGLGAAPWGDESTFGFTQRVQPSNMGVPQANKASRILNDRRAQATTVYGYSR